MKSFAAVSPIAFGALAISLIVSGASAYIFGGGRDARRAPPKTPRTTTSAIPAGQSPDRAGAKTPPAEEVEIRLTHALETARIEVPNLTRGEVLLAAHWRRMQLPWVSLPAAARKVTTSIALRTSADEKQWAMPKKDGGTWAPDARVWNMNEGSFDQRESLFAPTPATLAFRVNVPAAARLVFAAASASKVREPIAFSVTVVDRDVEKEVCATVVREEQRWLDVSCDLGPFGGRSVELRLKTTGGGADAPGLALWGNPTVLARRATEVPYNVLFVVVDALRPDVLASFHDDATDARAKNASPPPLDAHLPKVPGLMPVLDELTTKGVKFTRAWSGGAWTRPGTLAMLGGALSSQLGVDPLPWVVPDPQVAAYYKSEPPLLPVLMRRARMQTRAFVNNYFMVGYAAVGVDMGFERVDDHRYRTRDTMEITESATRWLRENKDGRFFAFVNYNSAHEPWEPPARFMERLPPPCKGKEPAGTCGPNEDIPRKYMAEAAKDDEAIGVLLKTLDELSLRDKTLVVVTADHGETLSAAHTGRSKLDDMQVRFHHAVSNYEETTRVPIIMALPNVLPAGARVDDAVSTTDIAPTILEVMGKGVHPKMTGRSLLPFVQASLSPKAAAAPATRAIVSEGRGTRGLLFGNMRLLVREGGARTTTVEGKVHTVAEELYDLSTDPGERRDLAPKDPARVAELRARLTAAVKNTATADVVVMTAGASEPASGAVHLLFAGGGKARRVTGTISVEGGSLAIEPVGVAPDAARVSGAKADLAFNTDPDEATGLRIKIEPPGAALKWELFLDDRPVPRERFYGGAFGLAEPALEHGLVLDKARVAARASRVPEIDASRDWGVFVTRRGSAAEQGEAAAGDGSGPGAGVERATTGAAAAEMSRMLREWGYANRAKKAEAKAPTKQ